MLVEHHEIRIEEEFRTLVRVAHVVLVQLIGRTRKKQGNTYRSSPRTVDGFLIVEASALPVKTHAFHADDGVILAMFANVR